MPCKHIFWFLVLTVSSQSPQCIAKSIATHLHELRNVRCRQPSLEQKEASSEFTSLQNSVFVLIELLKS
jgi:hypothetical protein